MVLNYLKFSADLMLLDCLGTVALIMNNLSLCVLLEWSWMIEIVIVFQMVLEWMTFWWLHVLNWNFWVCGIGEDDYVDWEGLSCLWLPLFDYGSMNNLDLPGHFG